MHDYQNKIADFLESESKKGLTDAQIAAKLRRDPSTLGTFLMHTPLRAQVEPSLQAKAEDYIVVGKKLEGKGGLDEVYQMAISYKSR